jgi:hypothetical protein
MIEMTKIEGGLNYNGESRFFSYEYFELGFEVVSEMQLYIEFSGTIVSFRADDTTVDGKGPFNDVEEMIFEIYGELS